MAFIPIPNTAKATLQYSVLGQIVENTLFFLLTGGWDATSLARLCNDLFDWYTSEMKNDLPSNITLTNINATDQSSVSAPSIDLPITTGGGGTSGGSPEPLNATAAVKFLTGSRGRSYRGRNYWPVLRNNQLANALELTNVATTAIVDNYALLNSFLITSGADHVVASRYNAGAPRSTGVATLVTDYAMDNTIDSQRRRLEGRGI